MKSLFDFEIDLMNKKKRITRNEDALKVFFMWLLAISFCLLFWAGLFNVLFMGKAEAGVPFKSSQIALESNNLDKWTPNTPKRVNQLADAIYKAENSKRYPYGIVSIDTKGNEEYARKICKNTIRNQIARWKKESVKRPYLESLASRYCPIGASNDPQGLNKNWLKNVKWFLMKGK
jgi:hypothetical protein